MHISSRHSLQTDLMRNQEELYCIKRISVSTVFSVRYLLFGFAVLPLARLLFDVGDHGERRSVVTVSQVDDVGDGGQHSALAARPDRRVPLTHCQQQLRR